MPSIIHIGFLLFPGVTQLDLTGPAQVLSRVPSAKEYDPAPPFDCGSPEKAGPELVARLRAMQASRLEHAEAQIERAALVEAS